MNPDSIVRQQLLALLRGGNAHMRLEDAVADFPLEHINTRPPNVPYSFWHLLEHIRLTQWDILDFIHNPDYVMPAWPAGYWPSPDARASEEQWHRTLASISSDTQALIDLVEDPETDLYGDLPHALGYNILREILVVTDHNAYHIGELGILRQVTGSWPPDRA